MKPAWLITALSLILCSAAHAESRSVALSITTSTNKTLLVSIWSDEKSELKQDITIDDACGALKKMKGWGSIVSVHVVSDARVSAADVKKLMDAIMSNGWLELSYIRTGGAREWSEKFVKSKIIEQPDAEVQSEGAPSD